MSTASTTTAPGVAQTLQPLSPERMFEYELEVFRTESDAVTQFLYAFLAVHHVAGEHQSVSELINTAPLFWRTNLGALQTAAFIALGRIFDQGSVHNIDSILRLARQNLSIFRKSALRARKQGNDPVPPPWLNDYMKDVYEPTADDFRRLKKYVAKYRKIYEATYRDLRHKHFAHKEISDATELHALFAKTNIRELQKLLVFLRSFHLALLELFVNGRKPVLRPQRYSMKAIRAKRTDPWQSNSLQERITLEIETFLVTAAQKK